MSASTRSGSPGPERHRRADRQHGAGGVALAVELVEDRLPRLSLVDTGRLGDLAGHLTREELWGVDEALMTVLGLD